MKVNGNDAEPGCYIDSHWGQYGTDRIADICDQFGIELNDADRPAHWREKAEAEDSHEHPGRIADFWQIHHEQGDTLVDTLNNVTEGGYWSWEDGDFFLTQTEVESSLFIVAWDEEDAWSHLLQRHTDHVYLTEEEAVSDSKELDRDGQKVYEFPITIRAEDIFQ